MPEALGIGRPSSPEALPDMARSEEHRRGRLKVFLGAAPGVGKTYEMLLSAHSRQRGGADVVAGVVETHGRAETEALLAGIEIIPRKHVEYKGRALDEMDLDALLGRRPQVALVDELAHTNAPGSRHPKRYLDVEELLAAGIDVYTTLNIQHVESLNDVVEQITGIRVRETAPDSILDRADDIEVVDLAPDELIQRLREGKVYVSKQAERALDHYFSLGNLTALRELALRRTAQRVDEQLLTHMKAHAIPGPWPARERVLVCINEDPQCASLVRYAKRVADRLHGSWTALYVETLRNLDLSVVERDRIADTLRFAERLGGVAATLPARTGIADDVIEYARANNVTQIVIGKSSRTRWLELLRGSVVHDLNSALRSYQLAHHRGRSAQRGGHPAQDRQDQSAGAIEYCGLFRRGLGGGWGHALRGVPEAVFWRRDGPAHLHDRGRGRGLPVRPRPVAARSCGEHALLQFLFHPPIYSFTIADPMNVAALFFFMFAALIVSNLTARVRRQAELARNRAAITSALYGFSSNLARLAKLDDLIAASVSQIAVSLGADVVMMLPDDKGRLKLASSFPPGEVVEKAEFGAAQWCFDNGRSAGRGSDTLPGVARVFLALRTSRGVIGVVGLAAGRRSDIILTPGERRLLDALMDQTAVAIERVRLAKEMDDARVAAETERLRGALLTSLSHDLKTPLASILGAANSLREYGEKFDAKARAEMISAIEEEAGRITRFVGNLLDMTRLESGAVELKRQPTDLSDIIGTALRRTERLLANFKVSLDVEPDLPFLELDEMLFEQVLVNLLDNAAKYAPPTSTITIRARRMGGAVRLQIMDEGAGIAEHQLSAIFEKFYRVKSADRQRAGTGLGLAICRGFIEAMGGSIGAANRADRSGAVFTVDLPVPERCCEGVV